jgi:hypothetical protein
VAQEVDLVAYDVGIGGGLLDLTVVAGAIDHYSVYFAETIQRPNIGFSGTVTAKDKHDNTVTSDSTTQVTVTSVEGRFDFYTSDTYTVLKPTPTYTLSSGQFSIFIKCSIDGVIETVLAEDSSLRFGSCEVIITSTLFLSVANAGEVGVALSTGLGAAPAACGAFVVRWD